ncbi:DUF4129 domain-containing protein [Streptomyces roseus]|uniref:Membrane protein n=1 Tax=Streptomyces roseus TaxID=66430 RepID=A0A0J6XGR9_9ACTN|nr:DUF4129 domain-containing protein [Streptomyces roseus]KMO95195.1 membrane protein [Streptomyces roseus]
MGRERTAGGRQPRGGGPAVLVVGGVVLAALLLRPDTGLWAKGRGPLGGNPVLVLGLALLALLGGLLLRGKYREQVGADRELNPVEQRLADGVSRVLLAASLVVPLLVLVLHRFGAPGAGRDVGRGGGTPSQLPGPPQDPASAPPPAQHAVEADRGVQFGPARVLLGLGIALLVVVVVIAGLYLWRHLTRPPIPDAAATGATLDHEQERLAHAVDSGRRALLEAADARAAVIACYAAMEESLAASGVDRHVSDSPQDLLERAVAGGLPAGTAATTLTALFREARYSTHAMDAGHRDLAAAALAEISDGLRPTGTA